MEIKELEGRMRLNIRVPNYWQQVSYEKHGFECQKDVQVGAARVTLNIKLDLFAEQKKYRPILFHKSRFDGRSHRTIEWTSPRRKGTSPGAQKKIAFSHSPETKATNYAEQMSSVLMNCHKNSPGSPASPRIKKSALQDLYTKGGIGEIIYGDSKPVSKTNSPYSNWSHEKAVQHSSKNNVLKEEEITDAESDQLDVVILVECTRTNIPSSMLRHLEMTSGIGERPEQLRKLVYDEEHGVAECAGQWIGLLVPRVSVRSYSLLEEGALGAWLEIGFPVQVLNSCQNSLLTLSRDLGVMLETHDSSTDAVLITTDHGKLPAHLAILRARSNLLGSCKILSHTNCDIALMVDGRSPTLNKPPSLLQAASSELRPSDSCSSFETDNRENFSERNNQLNTVNESSDMDIIDAEKVPAQGFKRVTKKIGKSPLRKPPMAKLSPKLTSSDRLALFSKHSELGRMPLKEKRENLRLCSLRNEESKENQAKDLNQCFIECNDTKDTLLSSTMDVLHSDEKDNSLSEFKESFSQLDLRSTPSSKRVLQKSSSHKDNRVYIQVNMSTSVAKQFLEWVYTGESSHLPALCRPLLLAGRRHGAPALAAAAERHLALQLNVDNAPEMLLLAHTQQASHLLHRALDFVRMHAEEVTATQAWEDVISKCPKLGIMVTRSVLIKGT
ncbi:SKP1/BTB/POZ domain [Trinorchestia longiramus]|nr:SKP1/BTB/POZ domain [Trinorchestia longiramus]